MSAWLATGTIGLMPFPLWLKPGRYPMGRLKLLSLAISKYKKAAELNENNSVTLKNWGDFLVDMASLASDPLKAERLMDEAEEKFETAAGLYPGSGGVWRRWSEVIQKIACGERKNPAHRRELWRAALEKLERGVQASALSVLEAAAEKYETAVALEPENSDHHTGLSHILYQWAWSLGEPELKGG